MSVKSDKWIRRMALEHRMIEPFCEKQVVDGLARDRAFGDLGRISPLVSRSARRR